MDLVDGGTIRNLIRILADYLISGDEEQKNQSEMTNEFKSIMEIVDTNKKL
jgi:hypothetical protein